MIAVVCLFAAAVIALEMLVTRGSGLYSWRDTENSIGLACGWIAALLIFLPITAHSYGFAFRHHFVDVGGGPLAQACLFLLYDFLFYLFHRASHHIR